MASTIRLLTTAIILAIALSGCTVRVDSDESGEPRSIRSNTSSSTSSWSVTTNGCTVTDKTPQEPNPQDVEIKETEEVLGPLSKTWTWNVGNTSYQDFHVRLDLRGPQELPQYHANQLRVKLEGGCGLRPHSSGNWGGSDVQVSASTQPSGNLIDFKGGGPTTLGMWTLTVEAEEAFVVYDVEVIVDYAAPA